MRYLDLMGITPLLLSGDSKWIAAARRYIAYRQEIAPKVAEDRLQKDSLYHHWLIKRLMPLADSMDLLVVFVPDYRGLGLEKNKAPSIRGVYSTTSGVVWVTINEASGLKRPITDIAHTLAHEIRHAMHRRDRLSCDSADDLEQEEEKDCEDFAASFLLATCGYRSRLNKGVLPREQYLQLFRHPGLLLRSLVALKAWLAGHRAKQCQSSGHSWTSNTLAS